MGSCTTVREAVPPPRRGFGGLIPPNKAPSVLKLKHEPLQTSVVLVNFIMSSPPRTNAKPPH